MIDRQVSPGGLSAPRASGQVWQWPTGQPGDVFAEAPFWRTVPSGLGTSWFKPLCGPSKTDFLKGEEVA